MLREAPEAEHSATATFPPPPTTSIAGPSWMSGGEPVSVSLPGMEEKFLGSLVSFRTDTGALTWKPRDSDGERTLPLLAVKMVQVMVEGEYDGGTKSMEGVVELARGGDAAEARGRQDDGPSVREFEVVFNDGDSLSGRTVGFRRDRHGLYLFPLLDDERYYCAFVPHAVVERHNVGPNGGEAPAGEAGEQAEHVAPSEGGEPARETPGDGGTKASGEAGITREATTASELEKALARQKSDLRQVPLGGLLVDDGVISGEQLEQALELQRTRQGTPLGEVLIEMELLARSDLHRVLARKLGIPSVDLRRFCVDPDVLRLVPQELMRRHHVLPLCTFNGRLVLATDNPLDWAPMEAVSFATSMHVDPVIAPREEIERASDLLLNGTLDTDQPMDLDLSGYHEDSEEDAVAENQHGDNMVVNLVNQVIARAYTMGASDIHIEPDRKRAFQVRVRKDGRMRTLLEVPAKLRRALVARIKVMAGLNIAEHRKPQDGRIDLSRFTGMRLELRVATVPTVDGNEDVVLRVLAQTKPVAVDDLGLMPDSRERLLEALKLPYGLFLVTGPTGSGKTTTLHSLLSHLNDGECKIWTAEDPVEISHPGLRQVQVNPTVGMDFANTMRAFLRADPDVIMIGEMRDTETAGIAMEASLTGHMVFSTLHTNSACETVVRLLDMGMDPFNFSDALGGVLSQRLARRLCTACRVPLVDPERLTALAREYCFDLREPDESEEASEARVESVLERWREAAGGESLHLYHSPGCDECEGTGFSGRIALHELLVMNDSLKALVQRRALTGELRAEALKHGMRTLRQDGIEKVVRGLTDMTEVRRVCAR
jgi:type II secretory ATPase GspE/PulE/Tfp pilus assembly ATPase PilB-like protein